MTDMDDKKKPDHKIQFMPIGMSIGISIGVAIGAACNNIPMWMCLCLAIGVGLGTVIDASKKEKDE